MVRVGIIGAGYMGSVHAKSLAQVFNELEAYIYDIDFERAKNLAKEINQTQAFSLKDLLNKNLDLILITTPAQTHFQLIQKIWKLLVYNTKNILKKLHYFSNQMQKNYVPCFGRPNHYHR